MLILFAALVASTAPSRSFYARLASTFANDELPAINATSLQEKAPETFYKDRVSDRHRYKETVVAISNTLFEALMFRESETSRGGAMLAEKCQVDLVSCLFTENSAPIGGALVLIDCHTAFVFTNFSRCESEIEGGAISLSQGEATFDRVTIRNCRSEIIAGGLFAETVSIAIQNTTFYKNWAGNIGGGGLGAISLQRGYQRNQMIVLYVAVILLVVLVQIIQSVGTALSVKADKRITHK